MPGIKPILLAAALTLVMWTPLSAQGPGRPPWVKPGMRITHYAAAASVSADRSSMWSDIRML